MKDAAVGRRRRISFDSNTPTIFYEFQNSHILENNAYVEKPGNGFESLTHVINQKEGSADKSEISLESTVSEKIPFYVYPDPIFSMPWYDVENKTSCPGTNDDVPEFLAKKGDNIFTKTYVDSDEAMIRSLRKHPWRTADPEKAKIFVVPVSLARALYCGCRDESCEDIDRAFSYLTGQGPYKVEMLSGGGKVEFETLPNWWHDAASELLLFP